MARQSGGEWKKADGDNEGRIRARNEAKILEVSVRLFSAKGFDGTTISEIAEESGLPKANVYYYFKTKTAIYERLIAEVFRDWDAALRHIRPERDPREALADYVRGAITFLRGRTPPRRQVPVAPAAPAHAGGDPRSL